MPAPRKAQSRRPTPDKPAAVSFNMDTFENEGNPEPFVVVFSGKPVTFLDAMEVDWRDLMQLINTPERFFDLTLSDAKDRALFEKNPVPAFKLIGLVDAYMKHYGIDPGNPIAS